MLSLTLSVFVYQIISLLGLLALRRIVVAIASKTKDLDIKLIYFQRAVNKITNFNNFKMTGPKKLLVYFIIMLSIVISFLPTFISLSTSLQENIDYLTRTRTEATFKDFELIVRSNKENSVNLFRNRVFDNIKLRKGVTCVTFRDFLEGYLIPLELDVRYNPLGMWFESAFKTGPSSDDSKSRHKLNIPHPQQVDSNGVFTDNDVITYYFGKIPGDQSTAESSSLNYCTNNGTVISSLTDIEGHKVQAVNNYNPFCPPLSDKSLHISLASEYSSYLPKSALDNTDKIFRTSRLNEGYFKSISFSVSASYINTTHLTMGVKKTIHIDVFYSNLSKPLVIVQVE